MNIIVDMAWVQSVLLVAMRLAATLALTPIFAITGLTSKFRVLLILALAISLTSAIAIPPGRVLSSGDLVAALATELVLGAALGFGLLSAFATFQFAGRAMDLQMGFGVAELIDPVTHAQMPLIGTLLNLTAVAVFFALDGHLLLLRGLAYSFQKIPPGQFLSQPNYAAIVSQFGSMFLFAVALAAPVLVTLLLIDIAMSVVARTMPQVNVFVVSMPLKIMVGLFVLVAAMHAMGPLIARIFESLFDYWQTVIG